jgi:hypothetical protein
MTQADIDALPEGTQKWMWMAPLTSDKFNCDNINVYQVMIKWTWVAQQRLMLIISRNSGWAGLILGAGNCLWRATCKMYGYQYCTKQNRKCLFWTSHMKLSLRGLLYKAHWS